MRCTRNETKDKQLINHEMIILRDLEKVYTTNEIETQALSGINLEVREGEFLSVMGPSGCGKSTLLNMIGLLDVPTGGTVTIDGNEFTAWTDRSLAAFRNENLGFIFQSFHLINDLPVVDNVELPLLYRKSMSGKQRRKMALEALERVGLSTRTRHYPNQLSGGQKQRVAIARAVVGQPRIILADEPTGNLDSKMGESIIGILEKLNRVDKTTVIMVTHDELLSRRTHRVIHLFDGMQVN
jgi:putative ABC transport system ATP-binding protein